MDEGTDRVRDGSPRPADVGRVAGEADLLRRELGSLVSELDRRRQEALDLRLQLRRHPALAGTAAVVTALAVSGAVVLAVRISRRRGHPTARARDVRDALARIVENPREVASQPSVSKKIATAVGVAVATAIAKRLLERYVLPARAPAPQRRRGTSSAEGASARAQ
jgi:hypothetical protein